MGYGRTQKSAARRVEMKHAIRRAGFNVASETSTKELENLYRQYIGKKPPR